MHCTSNISLYIFVRIDKRLPKSAINLLTNLIQIEVSSQQIYIKDITILTYVKQTAYTLETILGVYLL